MSSPQVHDALVDRLVADARPVRPLWSPHVRLAVWVALQSLTFLFAVTFGLRHDLGDHLREPFFLLELALFVAAGAMAAAMALRAAVPGMASAPLEVAFFVILASAAVVVGSLEAGATTVWGWGFVARGVQCVGSILAFTALPWITLFVAVRRGAVLDCRVAGVYAGAAAFLFAGAAVRLACPIDEKLHVLAWHTTTIAIGIALSAVAGARWLERRAVPAV
jgi:hypothetical protein